MTDLIPIDDREGRATVNARDLHDFLKSRQDFSTWIKSRIEQYDFVEELDFTLHKFVERRVTKIDYHVSLNMAKELAMVERNERGKQARQYFIECERRAQSARPAALTGPQLMAAALIEADATIKAQAVQIEDMREDVEAHERLVKADGSISITEAAKNLGMRPKDLFQWLRSNKWLYKRPGGASWLGYQTRCNAGDLEHKTTTVLRADGSEKITEQVRITAKGLSKLAKLINPAVSEVA